MRGSWDKQRTTKAIGAPDLGMSHEVMKVSWDKHISRESHGVPMRLSWAENLIRVSWEKLSHESLVRVSQPDWCLMRLSWDCCYEIKNIRYLMRRRMRYFVDGTPKKCLGYYIEALTIILTPAPTLTLTPNPYSSPARRLSCESHESLMRASSDVSWDVSLQIETPECL